MFHIGFALTGGWAGPTPYIASALAEEFAMKDQYSRMAVGIALGVGVGAAIGTAFDEVAIGIAIGIAMGATVGAVFGRS